MSYKIAIASADGENINLSFGAAEFFYIYEAEGTAFHFLEKRKYEQNEEESDELSNHQLKENTGNCGSKTKASSGCSSGEISSKVRMLGDCRCVLCGKIGFNVTKQFDKMAITTFSVDCSIDEALNKITAYYSKTHII